MVDQLTKEIREYIWAKYIDFSHHGEDRDEAADLKVLQEYHRTHPVSVDKETYYLAILYFELAFTKAEPNVLFLARAQRMLERYRRRSGETGWEAIEDRIEEAADALADLPEEQRNSLIGRVDAELDELDGTDDAVAEPEPETTRVVDGMVFVPSGPFLSGPAKTAKELKSFWIDEYPVTNADYRRFVEATGYRTPKFWQEGRLSEAEAPVVGVSWYDAFKYAAFAGKSLPTKDQWEKSVRGTEGHVYPWGDEIGPEKAVYGAEDGTDAVEAVDGHPENVSEFGVRGAVGNVWEWTDSPDPNDPEQRVICGGSWVDDESFLRCDQHLAAYPKDKYDNIGFRCVKIAKD